MAQPTSAAQDSAQHTHRDDRGGYGRAHRHAGIEAHIDVGRAHDETENESEHDRLLALREKLWRGLSALDGVWLNGEPQRRVAGILNVSFAGVEGESLLLALRKHDLEGLLEIAEDEAN